jgi:hypothetical protein
LFTLIQFVAAAHDLIADDRESIMLKQCHDQFTRVAALESLILKKSWDSY